MTQLTLSDSAHGDRLKRQGQAAIEGTDQDFIDRMRLHAKEISGKSGHVTSDNLRVIASSLGIEPKHQNSWGAIMRGHGWSIVGRQKSALPSSHGREIKVWRYEP